MVVFEQFVQPRFSGLPIRLVDDGLGGYAQRNMRQGFALFLASFCTLVQGFTLFVGDGIRFGRGHTIPTYQQGKSLRRLFAYQEVQRAVPLESEVAYIRQLYGAPPCRLSEFLRASRAFLQDQLPLTKGDCSRRCGGCNRLPLFTAVVLYERKRSAVHHIGRSGGILVHLGRGFVALLAQGQVVDFTLRVGFHIATAADAHRCAGFRILYVQIEEFVDPIEEAIHFGNAHFFELALVRGIVFVALDNRQVQRSAEQCLHFVGRGVVFLGHGGGWLGVLMGRGL